MSKYRSIYKYPKALQWKVQVDYLNRLSPEEKDFLGVFSEFFAGGNALNGSSQDEVRRCWREQKQEKNCVLSRGSGVDLEQVLSHAANPEDILIEMIDSGISYE